MLEDQVAFLLQKYLGNYVRGLNKEALKISVWKGDVELTNMQLKPEALNALKLPVKVKAGFLGSVRLKVPWSKLGQEPVLVYLDRIFLLAEPATQIEGCSEHAIQAAKKSRLQELEMKLLEQQQQLKSEMNSSWLGSLISTIIGNLKLSITNIHVRYEDMESNPGHPFAAGLTLSRLSAVTIDDSGKETFATGGALDHIQKSVQLDRLAFYFDSDVSPWHIEKSWEDLIPSEWNQIFELEVINDQSFNSFPKEHGYILQPVTGKAKYTKLRIDECRNTGQALQQAVINLDDVTLCLSKDGYRDILKLGDNFAAFNQRLKYAHYRPQVSVKFDPKAWWRYAYKVVRDEAKKASGKLSWEQVLHYARKRKRYVSLYASLLKSDLSRLIVDGNEEIDKLDRELDIGVILQWRMLAHKFVEQSVESDVYQNKKVKQSWWSFGWTSSGKGDSGPKAFTGEDWERLNKVIGYKDGSDENLATTQEMNLPHLFLEIHMKHNASKLIADCHECLADLSCEGLACSIKTYSEMKVFDFKLESYRLLSPNGLLAESAYPIDSFVGVFTYKPFDAEIDWSFVAKASPCYMTYLKDSIDEIISFFKSNSTVTQNLALETAAAVQMTIDGVRRTAQQQVTQALRERSRFLIDLDISAPKITIPTNFYPDDHNATKLLLDLGNLILCTEDYWNSDSSKDNAMYFQFSLILNDVSAFLVDGDYHWRENHIDISACRAKFCNFFPVLDKCGIALKFQQIHSENPLYPSMRTAVRLPSLGFHFSPARYHRLVQIAKLFQDEGGRPDVPQPWSQADFEGWLSVLTWKGVGNREAVWQPRYLCLVGPFLYILENPESKSYKQCISLLGKQVHEVPKELFRDLENVLAMYDAAQFNLKVEDISTLVLLCDSNESRKIWHNRIQGAIYRVSGAATFTGFSEISATADVVGPNSSVSKCFSDVWNIEKLFVTGVLDELTVCFNCSYEESDLSFKKVLLGKENQLFEFRALGGQVELSIKEDIIYVGTLLKSLEILDQYQFTGALPRYLARSFIKSTNDATLDYDQLNKVDSGDKFFEALDELDDASLRPTSQACSIMDNFTPWASSLSLRSSMKPPRFSRIPGLLPSTDITGTHSSLESTDTMDSFVKAQIVIYSRDSPHYHNLDNRVSVTLATLSFFCHRPTIFAILRFVNSVNIEEKGHSPARSGSRSPMAVGSTSKLDSVVVASSITQEPLAKGFPGRGKARIIFYLSLNMATAQIFLMSEDGISLATLSQSNLLADIKVFSSSFSIKAALGNLKISDDTLPQSHSYFWMCDMRNPGGRSFVELDFSSYDEEDEDYSGFDYALTGQLSEVRAVYLNRFVQEVSSYFIGLVPRDSENFVKLRDYATSSEMKVPTSEIAGSPAIKLDLSLTRPIILMPRSTDSDDYLKLDALHITVRNTFQWIGGDKNDMNAVHVDIMTITVEDINLTVGTGITCGESIIQDVSGLSVIIQRSLRDLSHQIPLTEATIQVEILKAALSNKEYEIITECASSNISESPSTVPSLEKAIGTSEKYIEDHVTTIPTVMVSEPVESERWITIKVSVFLDFVELSLHSGTMRDSPLACVQAREAWLLYKSNSLCEGFLFSTIKDFLLIDAREGIKDEFRLAIGKSWSIDSTLFDSNGADFSKSTKYVEKNNADDLGDKPIPSMLIIDATTRKSSTNISLCVQRPKLLVALDFLLAIAEFFVPSLHGVLSDDEESGPLPLAIILDQQIYIQPSSVFSLSPQKPLIVDDEKFENFIYDGKGGKLFLKDRDGRNISDISLEIIIHVGNRKRLQFKNVTIVNGHYLDSCVFLGSNSSYSVSEEDSVFLEVEEVLSLDTPEDRKEATVKRSSSAAASSTEFVVELQAIGPELTFYNSFEEVGRSMLPSRKAIHANLDSFCRVVVKGDSFELNGNVIGLKMESNGIRILEPFEISLNFSRTSGKTNIHLAVSDIFMNFSFSILRLFLAVQEDILSFLRMTSRKVSVMCSQFDRVGTIQSKGNDQIYTFWRPRAPSGFAVLGDCLTPLSEPPSKGVLAVNTSFAKVKRPVSYRFICAFNSENTGSSSHDLLATVLNQDGNSENDSCSIWFPVAPKGYVAVGCVVSQGSGQPSLSSALCILSSLVSPSALKDCIAFPKDDMAFWRVENSLGSFLPTNPTNMTVDGRPYDLRHMVFGQSDKPKDGLKNSPAQNNGQTSAERCALERPLSSGRLFEVVARFKLIWWNQGANIEKKLSIWRPVVSHGMVFLGDLAVQGYEPPNSATVLHETDDEIFLRRPQNFQPVGHIKKHRGNDGVYFWLPLAPPGFVSLGCIATKGPPKSDDLSSLRCIRSDMVTGDQFFEENIWDTSASTEPFSLWRVGAEVGTFIVRKGYKKPPKRFALKLAIPNVSSGSDNTVIGAEIKTFSVAVFDDYGGLMVPLFNISLNSIGFNLHGSPDYINSTMSFSLAGRSFNDKYDSWEPLIEPMDGFLRYQYDQSTAGPATQVRMASTKDLNLNLSVSNANMIFQAYASWNNLSLVDESCVKNKVIPSKYDKGSLIDIHRRRNYFIIPQNKLGQDIYIRVGEAMVLSSIIKMPSGGKSLVKVPVSNNMLDSHLNGRAKRVSQSMLTVIISEAEFPSKEGMASAQYTVAVRLFLIHSAASSIQQQSARTCGSIPDRSSVSKSVVKWNEILFFKVDIVDNYMMEFIVIDMGRGEPVGIYSSSLKHIASELHPSSSSQNSSFDLTWRDLSSAEGLDFHDDGSREVHGSIKCAVLISIEDKVNKDNNDQSYGRTGLIQISPTIEGPWTTLRLNYASPAACWRLGNDLVASEVLVKDGNRYVSIRSLVSVTNNTNFFIDLRVKSKCSEKLHFTRENEASDDNRIHTDEFFETDMYSLSDGWISCSQRLPSSNPSAIRSTEDEYQETPTHLQDGWEWIDEWQVDNSVETPDGWVYAPDIEHLKWPESSDHSNSFNYARQRRWIRHKKYTSHSTDNEIPIGLLEPGHTIPLPLFCLVNPGFSFVLQLRPKVADELNEYSWSSVVEKRALKKNFDGSVVSEVCVSSLIEANELLYCSEINELSSDECHGLWFCLSIQAIQIGKDIHSVPIHDWKLTITSPLSISNFLPLSTEFSVSGRPGPESTTRSQGTLIPGKSVKIYNADLREQVYLSLFPHGGWDPINEPILISNPSKISSRMTSLTNSYTGRTVMVVIEQNFVKDQLIARTIRIYVPYWIASARCPALTYYIIANSPKREKRLFSMVSRSNTKSQKVLWKINDEEMTSGYTIASALNFKHMGICVSLDKTEKEQFEAVTDLSPLNDMDGSIDLYAYDGEEKCMRILISSKPSPYEAVPTKVILVRPFMTFTNRIGREVFIKFNDEDQPKILHASDTRVSFVYCKPNGPEKIQVRLQNTSWCLPLEIVKEDTFTISLRNHHGGRTYLRAEVRGYEDGSRFLLMLRVEPENGPIRIENRMANRTITICQSCLDDDNWIQLEPRSTLNFSWDDPYGQRCINVNIRNGAYFHKISLEEGNDLTDLMAHGVKLNIEDVGDIKVVRFMDEKRSLPPGSKTTELLEKIKGSSVNQEVQISSSPLELIIELGIVGISLIDHQPRELLYLYLETVFISYSVGYDAGKINRFKLILGKLQLDNQLPLTAMPVILAPEDMLDIKHPVFKTTITLSNESSDGIQVYPYVYVRVCDKYWRINIHEPIIWALVDFYNNLRLDSIPSNSNVTQVDPEIRMDLIDVSEIRLKLSLETSPNQRPHGALGMWGPIFSAVGNAFKLQLHLRKVMHRSRFMRKSLILPSILNRIKRDLIHNPLHIICSVDVLSMTKSTLASLSKGFAELSTDRQFLQLRSKQVWSRRITGFSDGILQGTEAFAQGVAFGVTGVLTKPVENARQHGFLGLAHGIGRAFLGVVVQPLSGALDFVSLTVDGIGASFSKCLNILNNKATTQRIRNPRAIHANGVITEYCSNEAVGQMILYLAEASRHLSCTDLFKEPSKYAWSDYYEDHFIVPYHRIVLITNQRVMLLQAFSENLDRKPSKIIWDVPWGEVLALELAKAGHNKPSHLIIHLKYFRKSESFVRVVKCNVDEEEGQEPQAGVLCSRIRRMWKAAQSHVKTLTLKVPSSQHHVQFAWGETEGRDSYKSPKPMIKPRGFPSASSLSEDLRFKRHCVNFQKIWSSEQEYETRCTLFPKQIIDDGTICSIWRPICPDGYISVGDVAHIGNHEPHVAAIYRESDENISRPVGYDLVWRNCSSEYRSPLSIWLPRPLEGFVAVGCVAAPEFEEPPLDAACCISADLAVGTEFDQMVWMAPDSYPWACYIYLVRSDALQFIALRQPKEESDWRPMTVSDREPPHMSEA